MATDMEAAVLGNRPWMAGSGPIIFTFEFTTNGSGVPTAVFDYNDTATVAQATNTYTVTCPGTWGATYGLQVTYSGSDTIALTRTYSATAGTITLAFGAAMNSQRVTVTLHASNTVEG